MGLIRRTPLAALRAGGRVWGLMRRRAPAPGEGRCLILSYHDIADGPCAELFARQMEYLSTVAVVLPLPELLKMVRRGAGQGISCAITFDDGYEGVYRNAFPRLLEYNFSAMVYLSSGFIRESFDPADRSARMALLDGPLLSWPQVREMDCRGMLFGSHTSEHGDLSVLGQREAMEQLRKSRQQISDRLGKACEHFAYPFGRFSTQAVDWVREAGFHSAATTVHQPLARSDDFFRLTRAGIEVRYSLSDFKSIIRGEWDFIGLLQTLRRPALRMRTADLVSARY